MRIFLTIPYAKKDIAKSITGCYWHPDKKQWSFPEVKKYELLKRLPELYNQIRAEDIGNKVVNNVMAEREKNIQKEIVKISPDFKFKLKPYSHQIEMLHACLNNSQFALFCEMGTGKTKVIIDLFSVLNKQGKVNKCLIITPLSTIDNWINEVEMNSDYHAVPIVGTKDKRMKILKDRVQFFIINYEGILLMKDIPLDFDIVVLDESSKIKNPQAKRTKIIVNKFLKVPYKYIMSGTPVTQNPIDIYPQYKFLNNEFLGFKSWYSFRNFYCIMGGYGNYEIVGYRFLDQLSKIIDSHCIKYKKIDCIDLPPKVYEKRILDMSDELKKQYKQMQDNLLLEVGSIELTAPIMLTKLLRLHQISSGYLLEDKYNNKLKELKELFEENLGNGNKMIIWCRFIETIKMIKRTAEDMKIKYSLLYGETKDRKEQIYNFNSGDNKIFIGQISTGGLGINLQSANFVIYYENDFSLQNRLQSEDRSHRIGTNHKVTYIDLVYKNSIDEDILLAIQSKGEIADKLIKNLYNILGKKGGELK